MKLRTFNPESCPSKRSSSPNISMNSKSGVVTISATAKEKMGLSPGDKVVLHQDEADQENWFLQNLGKKGQGFELREKTSENGGGYLQFNNTGLVRAVFGSVEYEGVGGKLLIGERVTVKGVGDLWTLITAGLRNK